MPGGGKSTIGRQLARTLGLACIDADAEIEKRVGRSVRDYFEQQGEEAFRDLEERLIAQLVLQPDCVIATGGGAVLREANRRALRDKSTVVYLRSAPEELFRRLRHDTQRPLLQVADPLRKLKELYAQRDPLYRQVAHFTFDTGRSSGAMLANMVAMQLELSGAVKPKAGVPMPPPGKRP